MRFGSVTLMVVAALALSACGSTRFSSSGTATQSAGSLRQSLAALKADAGKLLDGGTEAFKARVTSLRGAPVVVNQWASWCGPCKFEFPFFDEAATKHDGKVAFIGVNSQDAESDAQDFLEGHAVPFPHYSDQDASIARLIGGGRAWPTTAYYNAAGKLVYTHPGAYKDLAALEADIAKYALG